MGNETGVLSSRMLTCPPAFSTRHISASPLSRCWKFLMPKAEVMASKVLSLYDRCSQSSFSKRITLSSRHVLTFSRPISIMPSDMSVPTTSSGHSLLAAMMAKSPVPVAMSSTLRGLKGNNCLMACLRQSQSMPKDNRWLSASYECAMLSNIRSTCSLFSCPLP